MYSTVLLALLLAAPPTPPAQAPMPHEEGATGPEPRMMAQGSGMHPAVIAAWVRNLGSDDWSEREDAEKGLASIGWDGYKAARAAAGTSPDPEVRARAARLCTRYLSLPASCDPANPYPRIYNLACRYAPRPQPQPQEYGEYVPPPPAPVGPEPENQYELAVFCHYYYLLAQKREWLWQHRWGDEPAGDRPFFYANVRFEVAATKILLRDLLASGVSREWVQWLVDDMSRRQNYWPPVLRMPPEWLKAAMGFEFSLF